MSHLTKYEKETILLTSEGDGIYSIYTFNPCLKQKLAEYSRKYPDLCRLTASTQEGSETYEIDKARISIRLRAAARILLNVFCFFMFVSSKR